MVELSLPGLIEFVDWVPADAVVWVSVSGAMAVVDSVPSDTVVVVSVPGRTIVVDPVPAAVGFTVPGGIVSVDMKDARR